MCTELKEHPLVLEPEELEASSAGTLFLLRDRFFGNPTVRWGVRVHTPAVRCAGLGGVALALRFTV